MAAAISPLAPARFPDMPLVAGVKLATAAAGIRYGGRTDVLLALFEQGTTVAGVFTRSKCPSAPVDWCRAHLKGGAARALVVNSGNANAFTGKSGHAATKLTADIAARAAGCKPSDVFLASTGVIGERLGGAPITVCGIAKGAGMIAPDMATLLSFVFTDAPISPRVLQSLLKQGVADSFNAVTIDGDTSTSDTLLAFATGAAAARGVSKIATASDPRLPALRKAFDAVLANLAEQIARDGEGARKLVEIIVEGAVSKSSARKIALSIANSPLVKTAIAGEDANWGRVVMAVGKAGERGERDPSYDEAEVSAAMKKPEITLKVALGLGRGRDRVLTCDLTKEYVAINGDYRS